MAKKTVNKSEESEGYVIPDDVLETMSKLEELRASRPTFDDIIEDIKKQHADQKPAKDALLNKKFDAVKELTDLGISEQSARLIVGLTDEAVKPGPNPKPPKDK